MRTRLVLSACLLVVTCLFTSAANAVTQYTITDLGTLGGVWSEAYGMNEDAQVVGYSLTATSAHGNAFLWEDGVMEGIAPGLDTQACDINNFGRIVGWAKESGARHSYY